ncbi:MAG: metal ABC transporter ATP-binding protein [Desulfovibrionaceae bacterium]|nr:metal ABC transporter ATP-binding protein [Desulfovibrionaceae bacterium]
MEPNDAAVVFAGVSVSRSGLSILENVTAAVPRNSCTVIVGPNGAGKTTLLLALIGEVSCRGDIRVGMGRDGAPLRLGYVPQRLSLDRGMPLTVEEFLVMGLQRRPLWLGVRPELRERSLTLLASVKAEHLARRRLGALSGGELQRVLLALALQQEPELLVLDEPSAGVDFQGEHLFCELLDELRVRRGFTQLMVSHDLGMVVHHATHVICLKRGVVAEGPPAAVLTPETLTALFGLHMGVMAGQAGGIGGEARHV